jgi:uncharacterized membrane protein HdeD (DUF308 family)
MNAFYWLFGAAASFGGVFVFVGAIWTLLHGSHNYRGLIVGPVFLVVGILNFRAALSRKRTLERLRAHSLRDH